MLKMEDSLTLCRLMQPGDANISGNVHGGTILKMIEEAGMIVSTRHCNVGRTDEEECLCVLVRVERTDFIKPMYVGEIAHLHAQVTFCSEHSIEIVVDVQAENLFKGLKRLTNKATLWYVPVKRDGSTICSVPPIVYGSPEEEAAAKERYMKQKEERKHINNISPCLNDDWSLSVDVPVRNDELHTVGNAQSNLIHAVGVQDCGPHGRATGGVTMKLMDEVAGICSARHCHTNIVTASMDTVDFHRNIKKGSIMHLRGRPIFNSNKSLMIQVVVISEERTRNPDGAVEVSLHCACTAFFTYVSLSNEHKPLPVPPLKLLTEDEKARFEEGKRKYTWQKAMRSTL